MSHKSEEKFANDILQPLPLTRLKEYIDICAKNIPHAIRAHKYLTMQERWITFLSAAENQQIRDQISPVCKNSFYVPKTGNVDNCTFFAITEESSNKYEYVIFSFTMEPSANELVECFRQTKRIKWELEPMIASMHLDHWAALSKFTDEMGLEMVDPEIWSKPGVCVWLPKEKVNDFDIEIPDDIYVAELSTENAETINSVWPYRSSHSLNYISSLLMLNHCIGAFDKKTNHLLSWVLTNDHLAAGNLQTVECAQKRGLAKLVLKVFCKDYVLRENLDLLAFIAEVNHVSRKLFRGLGFEDYRSCSWFKLKLKGS